MFIELVNVSLSAFLPYICLGNNFSSSAEVNRILINVWHWISSFGILVDSGSMLQCITLRMCLFYILFNRTFVIEIRFVVWLSEPLRIFSCSGMSLVCVAQLQTFKPCKRTEENSSILFQLSQMLWERVTNLTFSVLNNLRRKKFQATCNKGNKRE